METLLATYHVGSDKYPYEILSISANKRKVTARAMSFKITSGAMCPTSQTCTVAQNPEGKVLVFTANKKGEYWLNDCQLIVGKAEAYRDPNF